MALAEGNAAATVTGRGLKIDGYSVEVHPFTKLTGDTTSLVFTASSNAKRIHSAQFFNNSAGTVTAISATTVIDNSVSPPTVSASAMGAGTSGVALLKVSKR